MKKIKTPKNYCRTTLVADENKLKILKSKLALSGKSLSEWLRDAVDKELGN